MAVGKIVKCVKSPGNLYQFSVWKNPDGHKISLKKFKTDRFNKVIYHKFYEILFSVEEFETFKTWITTFEKKK